MTSRRIYTQQLEHLSSHPTGKLPAPDPHEAKRAGRLLALGQHLNLNQAQTLALFGRFYREDVLNNPNGDDHANIRNFMETGHEGVVFETFPLVELQN